MSVVLMVLYGCRFRQAALQISEGEYMDHAESHFRHRPEITVPLGARVSVLDYDRRVKYFNRLGMASVGIRELA